VIGKSKRRSKDGRKERSTRMKKVLLRKRKGKSLEHKKKD